MPLTDRGTVLAEYIRNLINTNKVALNVDTVLYGDHEKIPSGITVTVMPGTKTRTIAGVAMPGGMSLNRILVIITVYNNQIGAEATERLNVDDIAEDIEVLLHQNTTMGDNIIHGFVETWDPGIRFKPSSMFRVTQMIFAGQSKTRITP